MFGSIEDIPTSVTDLTDHGKCTECGGCCSSLLPVAKSEIKAIRRYVRKHNIKPYTTKGPFANEVVDLTCPFLDNDKLNHKCMIYEVRPFICKLFICSKTMTIMDAMKIKNYHANEDVELVNMRELFCEEKK